MRNAKDIARMLLAAVCGVAAVAGFTVWILSLERFGGFDPRALAAYWAPANHPIAWSVTGVIALGVAATYASWFDALLARGALVRGLKFGAVLALWTGLLVLAAARLGLGVTNFARPLAAAVIGFGGALVYGVVVGVVYGAGRRYDEYRWGLGYGVPDRRSLDRMTARPSLA